MVSGGIDLYYYGQVTRFSGATTVFSPTLFHELRFQTHRDQYVEEYDSFCAKTI